MHSLNKAPQFRLTEQTLLRALHIMDHNCNFYHFIRFRALISSKTRAIRVDRAEQLLEWLEAHPDTVIIFSDKKIFTVTAIFS